MMDAQLNAGINIANNGFMLKHSPQENRTMFIAAGTAMAGMLGGITAIVAGFFLLRMEGWHYSVGMVSVGGFHVLFAVSLVLRVAAIGMALRIEEPHSNGTRRVWRAMVNDVLRGTVRFSQAVQKTSGSLKTRPRPALNLAVDAKTEKQRNAA